MQTNISNPFYKAKFHTDDSFKTLFLSKRNRSNFFVCKGTTSSSGINPNSNYIKNYWRLIKDANICGEEINEYIGSPHIIYMDTFWENYTVDNEYKRRYRNNQIKISIMHSKDNLIKILSVILFYLFGLLLAIAIFYLLIV
jgi:hypothetical protein